MGTKAFIKQYWLIVLAVLVGLVIYWLARDILPTTDAQRYAILANNFIIGKGFTLGGWPEVVYPPGYSFFLIPFLVVGFSLNTSVALLSALSLALLLILVCKICEKHFEKFTAIVFSVFLVVNGHMVFYTLLGMVEPMWLVCILASYYFATKKFKWNYFVAGVMAGIAYLIKPETLAYIILFLVFTLMMGGKYRNYLRYVIVVLVFVFTYSLWLYQHSGALTLSGKSATVYWDSFIENSGMKQYDLAYQLNDDSSVGYTLKSRNPVAINLVKRLSVNTRYFKQALFEIFLPFKLTLVALVFAVLKLREKRLLLLGLFVLSLPTLSTLVFHLENRYLIVLLVAVEFLLCLAITTRNKTFFGKFTSILSLTTLLLLTYYSYWPLKTEFKNLVVARNRTQSDLGSYNINKSLIISVKPVYSYYLKKDYYPLPRVGDYAKYSGFFANYSDFAVILDSWSEDTMPEANSYLKNNLHEFGLKQIQGSDASGLTIFIKD